MNPLHTESLAHDRIAQMRRTTRAFTGTPEPKPRPPLRWPLAWASLGLIGIHRRPARPGSFR
jgi:hypothetical protein